MLDRLSVYLRPWRIRRRVARVSPVWTAGFKPSRRGSVFCHTSVMPDQWIDSWLGPSRFQRYVTECAGDRAKALELYEWNVAFGQALMHDIAHVEVALRNSYDRAISARWAPATHWLLHAESPAVMPIWRTKSVKGIKRGSDVNFLNRQAVDKAIARCGYGRATPGKVLAELTFGFWRQFTTNAMEKSVWVPYLHTAFPAGTRRHDVDAQIEAVNKLRNRIAHHEPLITSTMDPALVHSGMMDCLLRVQPEVHAHVTATSKVDEVLALRP